MKCTTHGADATAICVHCGVALCPSCATKSPSDRFVCSPSCAEAITKAETAATLILEKTTSVSAFFCFLLGGLFIVFAVIATAFGIWPLGAFLGVMGIGYVIGGFEYRRARKKKTNQPTNASSLLGTR